MNRDEVLSMLNAMHQPLEIAQWLRSQYFPEIINLFNNAESRKRFGLYQNEKIPSNERNLTDVRTRMGVLIEFELARISNDLLLDMEIDDIFWSYVIANRFPDLEIRNNNGNRLLRFEIKCLQCIAEEKSANFDTLLKDINPGTDFVIVCLWDWDTTASDTYSWDAVPQIYKVYVFHAYSLAMLRDTYWLNRPPANLGFGFQGFDVRYAVTCADGIYSKEQGNYGKLTRIWKSGFAYRPASSDVLIDTESEYISFQKEIIGAGFEILAKTQLKQLRAESIDSIIVNGATIGYKSESIAYVLSSVITARKISHFANIYRVSIVVSMTEKYRSNVFLVQQDTVSKIAENEKPKNIIKAIESALEATNLL